LVWFFVFKRMYISWFGFLASAETMPEFIFMCRLKGSLFLDHSGSWLSSHNGGWGSSGQDGASQTVDDWAGDDVGPDTQGDGLHVGAHYVVRLVGLGDGDGGVDHSGGVVHGWGSHNWGWGSHDSWGGLNNSWGSLNDSWSGGKGWQGRGSGVDTTEGWDAQSRGSNSSNSWGNDSLSGRGGVDVGGVHLGEGWQGVGWASEGGQGGAHGGNASQLNSLWGSLGLALSITLDQWGGDDVGLDTQGDGLGVGADHVVSLEGLGDGDGGVDRNGGDGNSWGNSGNSWGSEADTGVSKTNASQVASQKSSSQEKLRVSLGLTLDQLAPVGQDLGLLGEGQLLVGGVGRGDGTVGVEDSSEGSVGNSQVERSPVLGLGRALAPPGTDMSHSREAQAIGTNGVGKASWGNGINKAVLVDVLGEPVEGDLVGVDQGDGASPLGGSSGSGGQSGEGDERLHF